MLDRYLDVDYYDYRETEEEKKLNEAKDAFHHLLKELYSEKALDVAKFEDCLNEIAGILEVNWKFPAHLPTIQRTNNKMFN